VRITIVPTSVKTSPTPAAPLLSAPGCATPAQ
jgi:hypothetical protein